MAAEDVTTGTWEVTVGDLVAPVEIQTRALYDPTSARVRG